MPRFRRPVVAVLVLVALWPTLVFGQQPKAGIVSTLEGSATAARVALPQPVSLRFKDDVFLQDRITTGEKSLVRLLLGGKASVTVRERSTLTITEVPGRSTVDLEAGKVGVAVARDRMRPGEVLEIRMPTAIAAVRGTVVIAEVLPSGQINLFVLSGSAQLFGYDPATGTPVGPGVMLNAGQVGSVMGAAPPVVGAFTPEQLAGIQGGLVPGAPQHDQPVNQNQIVALQLGTTSALVQALGLGAPGGPFGGQQGLPGSPDGQQQSSPDFVPITPLTGIGEIQPPAPVDPERVLVSGLHLVLQPGASLKTMAGQVTRLETTPLIEVLDAGVSQLGADNLIQVLAGADWSLASPLLAATDSAFNPPAGPTAPPALGRNLLDVQGALRTTAITPFLSFDPTTVTVPGDLVHVGAGGSLTIPGTLLSDAGGTYTIGGSLLSVSGGGSVTASGTVPLVQLDGTALTVGPGRGLIEVAGASSQLTSGGPLLDLANLSLAAQSLADAATGGLITLSPLPGEPVVRLRNSTLTLAGPGVLETGPSFVRFLGDTTRVSEFAVDLASTTLSLGGHVLSVVAPPPPGGPILASGPLLRAVDSTFDVGGSLLDIGPGASLSVSGGSAGALLQVDPTTVVTGGPVVAVGSGATLTLDRALLGAADTLLFPGTETAQPLVFVGRLATLTSTAETPLVSLAGGGLATLAGGDAFWFGGNPGDPLAGATVQLAAGLLSLSVEGQADVGGHLLRASAGSHVQVGGPVADVTDGLLTVQGSLMRLEDASHLVLTGGSPVRVTGGTLAADSLLSVDASASALVLTTPVLDLTGSHATFRVIVDEPGTSDASVTLDGALDVPLVRMTDSTLTVTGDRPLLPLDFDGQSSPSFPGVGLVADPSTLVLGGPLAALGGIDLTGTAPFVQLLDTTVTQSGPAALFLVSGLPVTLAAPLLSATDSHIQTAESDIIGLRNQASLTKTGAAPLVELTGSLYGGLSTVLAGAHFLGMTAEAGGPTPSLTLDGPLLTATRAFLTTGNPEATRASFVFVVDGASLTGHGADPLVGLDETTVSAAGHLFAIRRSGATPSQVQLAGPLLAATGASLVAFTTALLDAGGQPALCCNLLSVAQGATFASTTANPLVQLADTEVILGNRGVAVAHASSIQGEPPLTAPASLTLAGPLLSATGGSITAFAELVGVFLSSLTSGTTAPLIQLTETTVTLGGVSPIDQSTTPGRILGLAAAAGTPATLGLQGPLLQASEASIASTADLIAVLDGATLASTTALPLLSLAGTALSVGTGFPGDSLLRVSGTGGVSGTDPASVSLAGPLLAMSHGGLAAAGGLVGVYLGAMVTATGAALPFVALEGGSQSLGGGTPGLFDVASGGSLSVPGGLLALTGTSTTLAAPLVHVATDAGGLTLGGPFLTVQGGSLTSNGDAPLVLFNAEAGPAPARSVTVADRAFLLDGGASVVLHGGLLSARETTFTTTDATRSFLVLQDGASLTTLGTEAPLLSFTGTAPGQSQVLSARHLLALAVSAPGQPAPSMALSGPLLAATGTTLTAGDPLVNVNSLAAVLDGATLASTTTLPLMSFDASSADVAGGLFVVRRSPLLATPSTVTLAGPLLVATNGSSFDTSSLGFGSIGTPVACCSAFSVNQGAQLTSTTAEPLIQLVGSTLAAGPDPVQSGGAVFSMLNVIPIAGELDAPSTVTLAGPLLSIAGGSTVTALAALLRIGGSTLTSTTPLPLLGIDGSTVTLGGFDPVAGAPSQGRVLTMTGTALRPATMSLAGPLFSLADGTVTTTGSAFAIVDNSTVSSTTTDPLIAVSNGTLAAGAGTFLTLSSGIGLPPSMTLAGPLLSVGSGVSNGDPASNTFSFLFVADGASLTSTAVEQALITLLPGASLDSSGNVVDVRRSASLTLYGPILMLALGGSTIDATSLGSPPICCNLLRLGQGGTLTSTGPNPLLAFLGAQVNLGPDPQSGGNIARVSSDGTLPADPPSPSTMTLAGGLAVLVDSSVTALLDFLQVQRSSVTSTGSDPLVHLVKEELGSQLSLGGFFGDTSYTGRVLSLVSSATAGTVGLPASVSLAGPLLVAEDSLVTISGDVAGVFNGAILDSATTAPFVQIDNSVLTLTAPASAPGAGNVLLVGGLGGADGQTPATMTLGGPLLSVASTLDAAGSLVNVYPGGQLVLVDFPEDTPPALVTLDGGTHAIASAAGRAMFQLAGRPTETALDEESGLVLAKDQPIRAQVSGEPALVPATLLETTGATVATSKVLRVDRALFEASAPVLGLMAASSLTSSTDAFELVNQAKVTGVGSLVRLDASALTVLAGALVNVGGGSYLRITGDLVQLLNGSTLTLSNGALLAVSGNSVVNLSGALLAYGSGSNTLSVANSLCSPSCSMIGGIPVALTGGAVASNVSIGPNAIRSLGQGGSLHLPELGPSGPALITVSGSGSRITLGH